MKFIMRKIKGFFKRNFNFLAYKFSRFVNHSKYTFKWRVFLIIWAIERISNREGIYEMKSALIPWLSTLERDEVRYINEKAKFSTALSWACSHLLSSNWKKYNEM